MQKEGRVLSLITQDPNNQQRFVVCAQTVDRMREFEGQYCFISICGDYRSGKSFLLNALFPQCGGFQTSATTNSCTKGINVWSNPIKQNGLNVWLVDTEGFGSIEKDADHDGKLFLLNILLSNLLLYNSVGAIDQLAIAKLALVCRHASTLDSSANKTKLFWVLRDFALQMSDRSGRQLSADQYLQQCLRQGHGGQRGEKQFLRGLFHEMHCVALIRPLIDEQKLGSLRHVRWESLREEFRSAVRGLQMSLLGAAEGKVVNGVHIGSHNFDVLLRQFVSAINGGSIDCALNSTYERILEYEQAMRKEAIQTALAAKVDSVRKIMPVQIQHLNYLRQQLSQLIKNQLLDLEGYSSPAALQLLSMELGHEASLLLETIFRQNRQKIGEQVRQYLYRQLVDLCPKLVSLSQQGFEARFQQAFGKLKEDCCAKYATFLPNDVLEGLYSQFAEREQRKVFFEVTKRWRAAQRDLQEKMEELRKSKRSLEDDVKKAREERDKANFALENVRREEARNLQRMKEDVEEAFREQAKLIARGYEGRMHEQATRFEDEVAALREALDRAQAERTQSRTEAQYEKQALLQRVTAQRERTQLLHAKWEQARNTLQLQLDQTKNTLQNKLRIAELKHSDLQTTLSNQRKKYQLISEERKSEEVRLLHELAQRNHRVDELMEELAQLQGKYRGELERILLQQKDILCKTLTSKLNQYDYRCRAYEAKLAQAATVASQRDFHEQRSEELQLETRQLRAALQEQQDRVTLLMNKIKKYEIELEERQTVSNANKEQQLREINLLNQNLLNSKNFLRQADQRHAQQIQWLKSKLEASMREQATTLTQKHSQNVQTLRGQWESKWDQEKDQLKEVIRNGYDEAEGLRMALLTLTAHTDKVAAILTRVLNHHHRSNDPYNHSDTSHLTDIAQSPDEDTDRQTPSKRHQLMRQTEFLAEEIEEVFRGLREELEYLGKERSGIREQLKASIDELQSYEQVINKLKQQNRALKGQLDQNKRKLGHAQSLGKQAVVFRQKAEALERENVQLRRQIELKEQLLASRDQNQRQSMLIYKETIASLTDQNRQLAARASHLATSNEAFEAQLERFQIWATEVKAKSAVYHAPEELDMSVQKIKDLENEIKRLARQLQQSKADKAERGREVHLYTPLLQENRTNELEALRAQNQHLLQQLQEKQQLQLKSQQEKRINRQRQNEQEEARYSSLKEDYQGYRRRSKETIAMLESKIALYEEENKQVRQEFQELEDNILQKYEFSRKVMEQETEQLKRQKQSLVDFYSKKIQSLQQLLNSKTHDADKRMAETDLKFQQYRGELEKEHNRILLEGERHRLKYQHLLKVNGELIKEVEALKSKAHQITIKEKYKSRISSLFDD